MSRPCARIETKKRSKPRPNRWKNFTEDQKQNKRTWSRKYIENKGIAHRRIPSYKSIDKKKGFICDLTIIWYKENIENKPCIYCGFQSTGCDRKDNSKGHTMDNVVPCCLDCNTSRMNLFTFEEMLILGKAITQIKQLRISKK